MMEFSEMGHWIHPNLRRVFTTVKTQDNDRNVITLGAMDYRSHGKPIEIQEISVTVEQADFDEYAYPNHAPEASITLSKEQARHLGAILSEWGRE